MTDRYAVIGNPIAHSRSPAIHAAFARQTEEDIAYEAILAPLDRFADTIARFRAEGGLGVNITVPFKYEAWQLAEERSDYATLARAVNTLDFRDDRVIGHNTDGVGLIADLQNHLDCPVAGLDVLLLGAGGASFGVVPALLGCRPSSIHVANRTADRARELVAHFVSQAVSGAGCLTGSGFDDIPRRGYGLVINATSTGLAGEPLPVRPEAFTSRSMAYEMVYGKNTPFMQQAREAGARVADGLGMLVEQAAAAFHIWRGVRPDTAPVIRDIRAELTREASRGAP